jgi:hypothetical protein
MDYLTASIKFVDHRLICKHRKQQLPSYLRMTAAKNSIIESDIERLIQRLFVVVIFCYYANITRRHYS